MKDGWEKRLEELGEYKEEIRKKQEDSDRKSKDLEERIIKISNYIKSYRESKEKEIKK